MAPQEGVASRELTDSPPRRPTPPTSTPSKGIWSVLKRGVLASLAVASFGHLVQVMRHGLKKIQYQPGLIVGCLAGTGLALDHTDIMN